MEQRKLTQSITCSAIGFGAGSIAGNAGGYSYGDISEKDSIATLEYAYSKGITLFDTAPIYGFGNSEKRIGLALSRHAQIRKNILLVTKLGVTWSDDRNTLRTDNSPDCIHRMLAQSLKDLQTDYIDLYMIHWPDANTPIEKTMEVLKKYKEQGVIRAIGASNFGVELTQQASTVAKIETLQSEFSVLNNTNAKQLFGYTKENNIGFMSYGTLAKGMLSGQVTPDKKFDASDIRSKFAFVKKQAISMQEYIAQFTKIADNLGVPCATLAAAYVLSFSETSVALCGAKKPPQIDDLVAAASLKLTPDIKQQINSISDSATPIYLDAFN